MRRLKRLRRVIGTTLAFVLAFCVTQGMLTLTVRAEGTGTGTPSTTWYTTPDKDTDGAYLIKTEDDLAGLAQLVNGGTSFSGQKIRLHNNIDITNYTNWVPIGSVSVDGSGNPNINGGNGSPTSESSWHFFEGEFDGKGFTVSGLKIATSSSETRTASGLFGAIKGATIRNFTISNVTIDADDFVGALVGYAYNSNLYSVNVTGTISIAGNHYVGGAIGYAASTLLDNVDVGQTSATNGSVSARDKRGLGADGDDVGGVIGYLGPAAQIVGCDANSLTVSGERQVGGVVGMASAAGTIATATATNLTIECATSDHVNSSYPTKITFGGLVGAFNSTCGTVSGCAVENITMTDAPNAVTEHARRGIVTGGVADSNNTSATLPSISVTGGDVSTTYEVAVINSSGTTYYVTLADAISAASAGDTVKLLANANLTSTQEITKNLTLNLNGYNITATGCRALWVKSGEVSITGSGTISATGSGLADNSSVIRVGNTGADKAKVTIGSNVTVSSDVCYGVTAFGKNTNGVELVVNGTVSVTGNASAISGNGKSGNKGTVTINDGATVTATSDAAIYHPQNDSLTINGGTITGPAAVYVKSGTVTISGGTLAGNGAAAAYSYNSNGLNPTGDALVVDSCAYPGGAPTVSITGGSFTSTNAKGIGDYAGNGVTTLATVTANSSSISLPDDELWVETSTSGTYKIAFAVAKYSNTKYTSLKAAFDAVSTSDPVTIYILRDIEGASAIGVADGEAFTLPSKEITLDSEVSGGVTINFGNREITNTNSNARLTITNNVSVTSVSKTLLSAAGYTINGSYSSGDIGVKGGRLTIGSTARVGLSDDAALVIGDGGDASITGSLESGAAATATSESVQQFTASGITFRGGSNDSTLALTNTYVTIDGDITRDSSDSSSLFPSWMPTPTLNGKLNITLSNSVLDMDDYGTSEDGFGGHGSITLSNGSRIVASGGVYLASGDAILLKDTSSITAGTWSNNGSVIVDVTNLDCSSGPHTVLTVTGGGTPTLTGITLNNNSSNYVLAVEGNRIVVGTQVAKVTHGSSDSYYPSLRSAIEAAGADDTVTLLANDESSFATGGIVIDKNLTIDGGSYTVKGLAEYGVDNVASMAAVTDSNVHGFYIKSGDVTIQNLTMTQFGNNDYVNKFGMVPILTASDYTGTLTINNVSINEFNRQAICINGGDFTITGGTINGNATNKGSDYNQFQQGIEIRGGSGTISGTTVTGGKSNLGYSAIGIVSWSTGTVTLANVNVDYTGIAVEADYNTVTINGDSTSIKGSDKALFVEDGGTLNVTAGDYTGELAVDSNANSTIAVSGGTFDRAVALQHCAAGYAPVASTTAGKYTVISGVAAIANPGNDGTYYVTDTLAGAIGYVNNLDGTVTATIYVLCDCNSSQVGAIPNFGPTANHVITVDTVRQGGVTLDLSSKEIVVYNASGYLTFTKNVSVTGHPSANLTSDSAAGLTIKGSYEAGTITLAGRGSVVAIESTASVSLQANDLITLQDGTLSVTGNLADNTAATITASAYEGTQQLSGGRVSYPNTGMGHLYLLNTFVTVGDVESGDSPATTASYNVQLNNSVLYVNSAIANFNLHGKGSVNLSGSQIVVGGSNSSFTLNSGDALSLDATSTITTPSWTNNGTVTVDVSGLDCSSEPHTIVTVTGDGAVTAGTITLKNNSNNYEVFVVGNEIVVGSQVASVTTGAASETPTYYPSLAAAVAAASAGDTVTLLKDVTLSSRVDVGKNLAIDLGGYTIKPQTTCANGSAFNITAGSVTIKNGKIDGTEVEETENGNVTIANGICLVTVRSGAHLGLYDGDNDGETLSMVINSRNGSCVYAFSGGTINIYSGTYENQTTETYGYNSSIKGMTVNQANVTTCLVSITGGTFKGYDPQLGDDSGKVSNFVSAGYVAIPDSETTGSHGTFDVKEGYVVTFDSAGGSDVPEQRVEKGHTATAPENPTKDGATFAGWFYDGEVYDFSLPVIAAITLTAHWTETEGAQIQVYGFSLSLEGNIAVNTYLRLSSTVVADAANYQVEFYDKAALDTDSSADPISVQPLSTVPETNRFTVNGDAVYRFSIKKVVKEMGDKVVLKIRNTSSNSFVDFAKANGETVSGDVGISYSIFDYLLDRYQNSTNSKMRTLAKKMMDYGTLAKNYFDGRVSTSAAAQSIDDFVLPSSDVLSSYKVQVTGLHDVTGFEFLGTTLDLLDATSLRMYFTYSGTYDSTAKTIDGLTITDGSGATLNVYKHPKLSDTYYVEFTNIAAQDLEQMHTVNVTASGATEGFQWVNSPLGYAYWAIKRYESDESYLNLANAMGAMYYYWQAAEAYFTAS